jgi:hypothetical protein
LQRNEWKQICLSVTTNIIETASRIKQYFGKANFFFHHDDSHTPSRPFIRYTPSFWFGLLETCGKEEMFFVSFPTTYLGFMKYRWVPWRFDWSEWLTYKMYPQGPAHIASILQIEFFYFWYGWDVILLFMCFQTCFDINVMTVKDEIHLRNEAYNFFFLHHVMKELNWTDNFNNALSAW